VLTLVLGSAFAQENTHVQLSGETSKMCAFIYAMFFGEPPLSAHKGTSITLFYKR